MAAIDFPASPTVGQTFIAGNGVVYQWNGTLWLATGMTTSAGGDFFAQVSNVVFTTTPTVVAFSTVSTGNSGGYYNTSTGRFTPPAGRYQLNAAIGGSLSTAPTTLICQLRKNGALLLTASSSNAANFFITVGINEIVDANGTDYFEIVGSVNAGSPTNVSGFNSWFGAFPISGIKGPPGDLPSGAMALSNETILASPATTISVTFPANAKRVEIEFSAESSVSAIHGLTLMQGATQLTDWYGQQLYGAGASAGAAAFAASGSLVMITGLVSTGTAKVFKGGGAAGNINIISHNYGFSTASVAQTMTANNAALFSTVTGARMLVSAGNFLTGSWVRSYVVV